MSFMLSVAFFYLMLSGVNLNVVVLSRESGLFALDEKSFIKLAPGWECSCRCSGSTTCSGRRIPSMS
jgi:hypothetical protein